MELAPRDYRALVEEIADQITSAIGPPPSAAPAALYSNAATPAPYSSVATPAPHGEAAALARLIEHTLLAPDATASQIERLCDEATRFGFAAVCVNPAWLALAVARLRATPVAVGTVIGFPLGAGLGTVKRQEAAACLTLGADDLDMVINIGALKSGRDAQVEAEVRGVAELAHAAGARLKAILEMSLLSLEEKIRACNLAVAAGADYVKTSTGFNAAGGATVADVALLAATAARRAGVKAAGGIRTLAQVQALVAAGAVRIGTSHGCAIMAELAGAR